LKKDRIGGEGGGCSEKGDASQGQKHLPDVLVLRVDGDDFVGVVRVVVVVVDGLREVHVRVASFEDATRLNILVVWMRGEASCGTQEPF